MRSENVWIQVHIKSVQGSWDGGTIALKGSRLILTWENGHGAFEVDLEAPETRVTRNGEQINISLSSATVEFPEVQFRVSGTLICCIVDHLRHFCRPRMSRKACHGI